MTVADEFKSCGYIALAEELRTAALGGSNVLEW
jgi:hypothetical protein